MYTDALENTDRLTYAHTYMHAFSHTHTPVGVECSGVGTGFLQRRQQRTVHAAQESIGRVWQGTGRWCWRGGLGRTLRRWWLVSSR